MKAFTFLLVLFVISFVSCEKEMVAEKFGFGLENEFRINGEYQSIDNSLNFSITEINDSRCPSDVICVWEGKADVKIEVTNPVKGFITLSTYNQLTDTIGNYIFELKNISPYPVSTKTIQLEEYNVVLKIVDLTD